VDAAGWRRPAGPRRNVIDIPGSDRCLQRVIDALGTLAVRAVVTTGPAIDAAALIAASQRDRRSKRAAP
jgi:hypothetical protein